MASDPNTTSERRYALHTLLGSGGFGEVYLATVSTAGGIERPVAVKMLHPDLDPSTQGLERLRDEARLLSGLNHPSILKVDDLVVIDGRVSLVTEYVAGEDLSRILRGDGLPPRCALEVFAQLFGALDSAWRDLRIVHRDVKPQNIRVGIHGVAKLLDFGIARSDAFEREAKTSTEMMVGTMEYMAPERFEIGKEGDPASDVYAVACCMWEAFSRPLGEGRLFSKMNRAQRVALALHRDRHDAFVVEQLAWLEERVNPGVVDLLRSMLAFRAQDRPSHSEAQAACMELGPQLEGPSLLKWARDQQWTEVSIPEPDAGTIQITTPQPVTRERSGPPGWLLPLLALAIAAPLLLWVVAGGGPEPEAADPRAALEGVVDGLDEELPELEPEPEPELEVVEPVETPAPVKVTPKKKRPKASPKSTSVAAPEPTPEPAATWPVVFTSIPMGAGVRVDGSAKGSAPTTLELSEGRHRIELTLGEDKFVRSIEVTRRSPRRYVWTTESDTWEAGY